MLKDLETNQNKVNATKLPKLLLAYQRLFGVFLNYFFFKPIFNLLTLKLRANHLLAIQD